MKNELTERERNVFEYLISGGENLALSRTNLNGVITACIVILDEQDDGSYNLVPLAIVVNEELFSQLLPIYEEEDEDINEVSLLKMNKK